MIQIDQILYQLRAAVKHFPVNPDPSKMINTFAVIGSWADLDADNLGKYIDYKDTPYFYSRRWENLRFNPSRLEVDYPVMVVWETGQTHSELFTYNKSKVLYGLQIAVLDRFKRVGENHIRSQADHKVKEQIYIDTELLLLTAVNYLNDVIAIQLPDGSKELIHSDLFANSLESIGTKDRVMTNEFSNMLHRYNRNVQGNRWEGGKSDLYGTFINLQFELKGCLKPDFNFSDSITPPTQDKNKL